MTWLVLWVLAGVLVAIRVTRWARTVWARVEPQLRAEARAAAARAAVVGAAIARAVAAAAAEFARRTLVFCRRHWPTVRRRSSILARAVARLSAAALVWMVAASWLAVVRTRRTLSRLVRRLAAPARGGQPLGRRLGVAGLAIVTLVVAGVGGLAAAVVSGSYAAVGVIGVTARLRPGHIQLPALAQRSVMYAADGSVVAVLHGDANRVTVPLSHMSPTVIDAVVDTEDAGFWHHGAVDARAVVRAMAANLTAGRVRQGGSTIPEQLVKNTLYDPGHSFVGKAKEMLLADRLERRLGRSRTLERYLNTVYFGEGAYGVEAAAETFFGTTAGRLDAAQAALLAGMIQDPSGYDPLHHPAAARGRRATVLSLMVAHHHLSAAAAQTAAVASLPTQVNLPPPVHDYFSAAVQNELLSDPRLGRTYQDRYRMLFQGGLQIHTTLDPNLQRDAEAAVAAGIPAGYHLTAALAAIDPSTGDVRAVVGGPDFGASQFDAALAGAGRQPGSSFKVFTLVTALEQGHSINDVIDGSTPCSIPNPGGTPNPWTPANYEGEAFGPITLAEATAKSVNCAYARLALKVGLGEVAHTAHAMGITSHLAVVPSMTLGTNDVTPLQMASAYATLADDGVHHRPHLVQEVQAPDGRVIIGPSNTASRVISQQIARETTQALQQVVLSGTGTAAALPGRQVAGKTGTAENYQDAWFVGYTPQLATAVWMGNPTGEVPMVGVQGINVVGGSFPAHLWADFMARALASAPAVDFPAPDPTQVPRPTFISGPGSSFGSVPVPGGGSSPPVTTWCWSSCGRPGKHH